MKLLNRKFKIVLLIAAFMFVIGGIGFIVEGEISEFDDNLIILEKYIATKRATKKQRIETVDERFDKIEEIIKRHLGQH